MVDIDEVREKWRALGFDCSLWTDPPGKVWEGYVHAVDELLMPVAGVLEIDMDGKTLRPAAGEEVFIPARTVHNVRNVGGTEARWLFGYKKERRDPDACL